MTAYPVTQLRQISAPERQTAAMINYLRSMVLRPGRYSEQFHATFFDEEHTFLGDAPLGEGGGSTLSIRIREVLGRALELDAYGIILAHNHPSGQCRPSARDIEATQRLKHIAKALDVTLLDHLIFTHDAVYSMRAGGQL